MRISLVYSALFFSVLVHVFFFHYDQVLHGSSYNYCSLPGNVYLWPGRCHTRPALDGQPAGAFRPGYMADPWFRPIPGASSGVLDHIIIIYFSFQFSFIYEFTGNLCTGPFGYIIKGKNRDIWLLQAFCRSGPVRFASLR
jgi:hypothetical protein